jgi:hypothetical protein
MAAAAAANENATADINIAHHAWCFPDLSPGICPLALFPCALDNIDALH